MDCKEMILSEETYDIITDFSASEFLGDDNNMSLLFTILLAIVIFTLVRNRYTNFLFLYTFLVLTFYIILIIIFV